MRSGQNYGVLLSNLRSTAGLSQEMLARCVESSKSALSRLENGDAQFPFKGSVRKLVLRLAELLCSSRKEMERYLRLAGIDMTLLTEMEEFQLGFAPNLDTEASQERATLQRWESSYQQLIQQLQECETRLDNGNVPPPFQMKRQEYMRILQEIQAKFSGQKLEPKTRIATVRAKPLPPVVNNGLFRIGNFQGTWMLLDGDGTVEYRLENIKTHYVAHTEELPEELQERKARIEQEQRDRKAQGLPFAWKTKNCFLYLLHQKIISSLLLNIRWLEKVCITLSSMNLGEEKWRELSPHIDALAQH